MYKLTFNLILLIFLAGCLKESETNKQQSLNTSGEVDYTFLPYTEKINGHVVPPEPGAVANATVAGVDTDKNGIRDEIDRYIAQKYGAEKIKFAAAQELAKASQLILVTSTTDIKAATAALYADADSGVCAVRSLTNDQDKAIRMVDDIVLQTLNTRDRQKQYQAIVSRVGQFTRSTKDAICKSTR